MRKTAIYLVCRKINLHRLFFAVKVDGNDVKPGICLYMKTSAHIPGLTSLPLTLTAKKSPKIKFLADKIYFNFSHEHPKISNM